MATSSSCSGNPARPQAAKFTQYIAILKLVAFMLSALFRYGYLGKAESIKC
ncbi:hypothetical protein GOQ29_11355 [Clostridium sp. D2Q-14]|uniref:hypothetical protein n=1 Tax=Anaeromonas gelatinilytica TaxID=2683194 RepID=UPI00193B1E75|nr:hypothetical protein [Anaeromonas gelatinilytica]MBS4536213.1 hypothetical protein [Anaeromonas gelatinilytica]